MSKDHNPPNTILIGPIDTQQEIDLIIKILQDQNLLNNQKYHLIQTATNEFLHERSGRIYGDVDTAREVRLFLSYLRRHKILQGPIDTKEEIDLFMQRLEEEGYFAKSIQQANRYWQQSLQKPSPSVKKKKKPKPHPTSESDDDSENI